MFMYGVRFVLCVVCVYDVGVGCVGCVLHMCDVRCVVCFSAVTQTCTQVPVLLLFICIYLEADHLDCAP
jgi:hypothetical protein